MLAIIIRRTSAGSPKLGWDLACHLLSQHICCLAAPFVRLVSTASSGLDRYLTPIYMLYIFITARQAGNTSRTIGAAEQQLCCDS